MQLKTILNRIQKHRGFVYGSIRLREEGAALRLAVEIYPHLRTRPRCSGCGRRGPQYDTLPVRWFEFVPLWGLRVFFLYRMRRVTCAPWRGVTRAVTQPRWPCHTLVRHDQRSRPPA